MNYKQQMMQNLEVKLGDVMDNINNFANNHELKVYLDEFVEKIKYKILYGKMDAETIRKNLILIPLLKDRNLSKIFNKKIDLKKNIIKNDKILSAIAEKKLVDFIGNNEEFLRLCANYGKFLDNFRMIISEGCSIEEFEELILKQMANTIDFRDVEENSDLIFTFEKLFNYIQKNDKIYSMNIFKSSKIYNLIQVIGVKNALELSLKYGRYMNDVNPDVFKNIKDKEEIIKRVEETIENNIKNRIIKCSENAPEFFRKKYPQYFVSKDAPVELKMHFYGSIIRPLNFINNPDWKKFIADKNIELAISNEYLKLFHLMPQDLFLKLCMRNIRVVNQMIGLDQEEKLAYWYKKTGYKFVPSEEVMMNFPEDDIDIFLLNGKKWTRLVKLQIKGKERCPQKALLKMAYSMGVFHGNDVGFKQIINWISDLPRKLSREEYQKIISDLEKNPVQKELFCQVYKLDKNMEYTAHINQKTDKEKIRNVRKILEDVKFPRILTLEKMDKIFSEFEMKYDLKFSRFLIENMDEILQDTDNMKLISVIQKQYDEILNEINSGKKVEYSTVKNYKRNVPYENVDIGNEELAKEACIVKYSQIEFEKLQQIYNEGQSRIFSSIPRIFGQCGKYTYEMLRCDNEKPLTVGKATGTCISLDMPAEGSMKHSVWSPNGRIFIVRDDKKRIVAHSWVWRNQDIICFDSIEIPKGLVKFFKDKLSKSEMRTFLAEILEVYKQSSEDLMKKDEIQYKLLLSEGKITREQYENLVLHKITVGLGHGDIADEIEKDKDLKEDTKVVFAKSEERIEKLYTDDSKIQYVLIQKQKERRENFENLLIYEDDIPIFDETNMDYTILLRMRRMENAIGKNRLNWIINNRQNQGGCISQKIIKNIASEYRFEPSKTRVISTSRMAIVYSESESEILIGDVFTAPIKENLPIEKQQIAKKHLIYQIKKALKQIGGEDCNYIICQLEQETEKLLKEALFELDNQCKNSDAR